MKAKRFVKAVSVSLCAVLGAGTLSVFAGCGSEGTTGNNDTLVIMSEELDGLFSPFFATTGADMEVVGMTQLGMFTTGYEGEEGNERATIVCGDGEAAIVKDYDVKESTEGGKKYTTYTFVLKNGLTFSDGHPLTMEDVLFNMYVYLDPVYTGSSTMYSTDIVGLQEYRSQKSVGDTDQDTLISSQAMTRAKNRINELITVFKAAGKTTTAGTYEADEAKMKEAIAARTLSAGYKQAISNDPSEVTNDQLQADYQFALDSFKEELQNDFKSAKDAYTEEPYKSAPVKFDEIVSFMYTEGFVDIEYARDPVTKKEDKSKIEKVTKQYDPSITTEEDAINYVYGAKVSSELHIILEYWATATKMLTEFSAKAKEVILHQNLTDGELATKRIKGIDSLGHNTDLTSVNVNGTDYAVAREYNEDGTVKNTDEYAVLRIKINGVDPKAIWNFGFSVAPQHYYAPNQEVDIANDKFGVEWSSFDFMKEELQSTRNVKIPMGAGPYVATDADTSATVTDGNKFYSNNVVYFRANENFLLGTPKIPKLRYQVVSSTNALNVLEKGNVHFVTPQFTKDNFEHITQNLAGKGIKQVNSWQLGYGYIGINAGKVQNIYLRRAIMSAMDTSLSLSYYSTGSAKKIDWPMSTVSWAYPKNPDGSMNTNNGHDYTMYTGKDDAVRKIKDYMSQAGVEAGDSELNIKFTIAGSNLTEHPTYLTFKNAADILNKECGWNVEVVPDTQALTKLSTGSLAVWAAAWGSTVDPDMYQVYHKNSGATSTLAWGYREIKASPSQYKQETAILTKLSEKIDDAREITDETERTKLYTEAMGFVLDLAIEMPVYQRKTLYAYNAKVIKESSLPAVVNPYSSPLAKIWEIELV